MLHVVVPTLNAEKEVVACIRSILDQESSESFDVTLIDDGSRDLTVAAAAEAFGDRIRIVTKPEPRGWLDSLSRAIAIAGRDPLIVLGTHCVAKRDWLRNMAGALGREGGVSFVIGPVEHGPKFMQKLCALTLHAELVSDDEQLADFLFDDNFACDPEALRLLLAERPTHENLSDGLASALLSASIRAKGIPVLYEPSTRAFHVSPSFRGYLHEWYGFMAVNTIRLRRLAPSVRGSEYLKLGLLAPFIYAAASFVRDLRNVGVLRGALRLRVLEMPLLVAAALAGKTAYLVGMIRVMRARGRSAASSSSAARMPPAPGS